VSVRSNSPLSLWERVVEVKVTVEGNQGEGIREI